MNTFNQLLYDLNRTLNNVNREAFSQSLEDGRKLIITYDRGAVWLKWDPPINDPDVPTIGEATGNK